MSADFETVYVTVRGTTHLKSVVSHLSDNGVWFQVEPDTFDRYHIFVKPENQILLPGERDWESELDEKLLLEVARRTYPEEPGGGDVYVPIDAKVVDRTGCGFWITGVVWVEFPDHEV